jgi:organic radical activating enzyme
MGNQLSYLGYEKIFLEYYITINCNLNCASCSTFSPLVKGNTHKPFEDIKSETEKMYRITDNGKKIYALVLMGGEPLMHPDINKIIKHFGELNVPIRIVTNGILVPTKKDEFFDLINTYDVDFVVSIYPKLKYEKIFKKLEEHGCKYRKFTYLRDDSWGSQYLHREKKPVTDCRYRGNVYILRDNKIFTCSETAFFDVFDNAFKGEHGLKLTEDDYVDLDDIETLDELKERRKTIPPLCNYCDGSEKKRGQWKMSDNSIDEWLTPKKDDE